MGAGAYDTHLLERQFGLECHFFLKKEKLNGFHWIFVVFSPVPPAGLRIRHFVAIFLDLKELEQR